LQVLIILKEETLTHYQKQFVIVRATARATDPEEEDND
tara:strand:- start:370 stop:483 length:114 start_codon:yes stop_codon:yes gene_type:complete